MTLDPSNDTQGGNAMALGTNVYLSGYFDSQSDRELWRYDTLSGDVDYVDLLASGSSNAQTIYSLDGNVWAPAVDSSGGNGLFIVEET